MDDRAVWKYFECIADDFDAIYCDGGSLLDRFINKVFRKGMYERAALAIRECGIVENKKILDIGCGSGRIALALAKKGAEVVGIDFSPRMIEMANNYLSQCHVNVKAKFICSDFMKDFASNQSFDITLALGVFDYIKEPMPFLNKMRSLTKEQMIVSFPAIFTLQMPIRKLWLRTRGCPVYFYSKKKLVRIYESLGVSNHKLIEMPTKTKVPTDYLVICNLLEVA